MSLRKRYLAQPLLLVAMAGCSGPSIINLAYQHGSYAHKVSPVRVGVYQADDDRPKWPKVAAMRIYGRGQQADAMWHTEGDKPMGVFVAEALRAELAATGMTVSRASEFDRPSGTVDPNKVSSAEVDRVVCARINYFGVVSPVPELAPVAEVLVTGLFFPVVTLPVMAIGTTVVVQRQRQLNDGVTFGEEALSANAYVDIEVWIVDPSSRQVVWADTARVKRSLGTLSGAVRGQVQSFLAESLFLALHGIIWRTDFLAAMGTKVVPSKTAQQTRAPEYAQTAANLFAAGRFADAALEFKKAHDASGDPSFLYNMALCHRRAGNARLALSAYQDYLRKAPDSAQRPAVEKRIQELKQQLGEL
jgi:hypothetical protein